MGQIKKYQGLNLVKLLFGQVLQMLEKQHFLHNLQGILQNKENEYFSLIGEQTGGNFKNNLFIQCSSQKDIIDIEYEHTSIIDKFVKTERAVELDKLYGNKIFVYNNEEVASIDKLLTAMFYLRKAEKIKVFFLDNFMQIEMKSSDLFREQGEIMERLRRFAIATKSQIHLVAHPRKTEKSQYRLSLYDIARKL